MGKARWMYCIRFTHDDCGQPVTAAIADGSTTGDSHAPCGHCGRPHRGRLVDLRHQLALKRSLVRFVCGSCGTLNVKEFAGIAPMKETAGCGACGAHHTLESIPLVA
jgi:transcription elongation factor Elf1